MKQVRLLFAETSFTNDSLKDYQILEEITSKIEIVKNPYGRRLYDREVVELAKDCVGIVAGLEPYDREVLSKLEKLRCISRVGIGIDNIDIEFARKKGIEVFNTPDAPTRAVSEMAIGLIFGLLRGISKVDRQIKSGIWEKFTGQLLWGKTVGIIGIGRIGKLTARLLQPFGVSLLGYDIKPDLKWLMENNIPHLSLDELLRKSDIVILHLAPISGGEPIISRDNISKMKEGSYLINLSRGSVVDEVSLYEALKTGKLAGAALDVFHTEPYSGDLTKLDNVILTPHIGSQTYQTRLEMKQQAITNLIDWLKSNNFIER